MAAVQPGLIRDIEILRAVAVLAVIFQHLPGNLFPRGTFSAPVAEAVSGGWAGVDLFFAISGFVIARSFLPSAAAAAGVVGRYRRVTLRFWAVRLARLAPSAWLWLLVILLLCTSYNQSGVFGSLETNLLWTVAGIANFSNFLFAHYFGISPPGASFVYWSLSLEEQFYLCFPLAVWLLRGRLAWFLVILVVSQLFVQRSLYGMMFRTDAIALGVLIALTANHWLVLKLQAASAGWKARLLALALLFLLFYLGTFSQEQLPVQIGLVALTAAALVWLCSSGENVLAGDGRLSAAMLWIGRRSYAMYLIHIPVMFFLRETAYRKQINLADHALAGALLAIILIAVLAAANYRWLESPLRSWGRSLANRHIVN